MPFMPKHKMPMVFSTAQACEYMGIHPHTFRRYRDLLGIHARKMYGVRGKFYLLHEIVEMMNIRVPDERLYRKRVLDRYEAWRREKAKEKAQD